MPTPTIPDKQVLVRHVVLTGIGIFIAALSSHSPFMPTAQAQTPAAPMNKMEPQKPPAAPSTSLTIVVSGKAFLVSQANLQTFPQQTVTLYNQHTKSNETYSGVFLGDLLANCGFTVEKATHDAMLHSYVTAEGTDGYWVLYSLTEVEPSQHNGDVIVATSINGKPLAAEGRLKLISTEDKKPQRWVRNLERITVVDTE